MDLYKITYESILTGERSTYMGMGFSKESAERELRLIELQRSKYDIDDIEQWVRGGVRVPSYVQGINWKIEKIKFKK